MFFINGLKCGGFRYMTRDEMVKLFLNNMTKSIFFRINNYKTIFKKIGFLWNVVQYDDDVVYFYGDEARRKYDMINVDKVLTLQYYFEIGDEESIEEEKALMTSAYIDTLNYPEFYIFDEKMNFCYVITHEFDDSGPYLFIRVVDKYM